MDTRQLDQGTTHNAENKGFLNNDADSEETTNNSTALV